MATTEKTIWRDFFEVFIFNTIKGIISFFKTSFKAIVSVLFFIVYPNKVYKGERSEMSGLKISKAIFDFTFFAVILKVTIHELGGGSTEAVNELVKQMAFLLIYFFGAYMAILLSRFWKLLAKNVDTDVKIIDKYFLYVYNAFFFLMVIFIPFVDINNNELNAFLIFIFLIFVLAFLYINILRKIHKQSFIRYLISSVIISAIYNAYFWMAFMFVAVIWEDINTVQTTFYEVMQPIGNAVLNIIV